jgi:hypothetical protein
MNAVDVNTLGRLRLALCFVVAASMGLAGCPGEPNNTTQPPGDPSLEIGVIEGGVYRKLSDGDDVPVVRGAQGGIHVDLSLLLTGFPPGGEFFVTQQATMLDTGEVVSPEARILTVFRVNGAGLNQRDNQRVFLQGTQSDLRGRQGTLTVTVSDPGDPSLTVTVSVVVTFVDAPP